MNWNWQKADWPNFTYDQSRLADFEAKFMHRSGIFVGVYTHLDAEEKSRLVVELVSKEAEKTSEIEGEFLNRESLQSSIRRHLGLSSERRQAPAEEGISEMMIDLYRHYDAPLTHDMLYSWHRMLMQGRQDLFTVEGYRTHEEPMQVVSGPIYKPKIHFEAPPSPVVFEEMTRFCAWFNQCVPNGEHPLPPLTRAGIAHLYFLCIHPFEDGNGRIARAISERALSQSLGQPTLVALSQTIQAKKTAYYDALEDNNKEIEISNWLTYFAETLLKAQAYSQSLIDFLIEKTKLYDRIRGQLNDRQEKGLNRLFEAGPEGFSGGLSAEKYMRITSTSRATATRDLQDFVEKRVLIQTGKLKSTRYWLPTA